MGKSTSVRFNDGQRQKLRQLADALSTSPNAVVGMLVDNAELVTVQRVEAVSKLPARKNSRSASVSQAKSATAVGA